MLTLFVFCFFTRYLQTKHKQNKQGSEDKKKKKPWKKWNRGQPLVKNIVYIWLSLNILLTAVELWPVWSYEDSKITYHLLDFKTDLLTL